MNVDFLGLAISAQNIYLDGNLALWPPYKEITFTVAQGVVSGRWKNVLFVNATDNCGPAWLFAIDYATQHVTISISKSPDVVCAARANRDSLMGIMVGIATGVVVLFVIGVFILLTYCRKASQ